MRRSLSNPEDVSELKRRLNQLNEHSPRKWGRMSSAQMVGHCDKILQVGLTKIVLPETNLVFKTVGICTKLTMKVCNHGIPTNMPTFEVLKLKENCNFESTKADFLATFEEFLSSLQADTLLRRHALFGEMTSCDWAFLQYKHINHHLKQFGV